MRKEHVAYGIYGFCYRHTQAKSKLIRAIASQILLARMKNKIEFNQFSAVRIKGFNPPETFWSSQPCCTRGLRSWMVIGRSPAAMNDRLLARARRLHGEEANGKGRDGRTHAAARGEITCERRLSDQHNQPEC